MAVRDDTAAMLAALLDLPARLAVLEGQAARMLVELEAVRRALPSQLASVKEAAVQLGVSVPTVRRLVKAGDLPSVRVGGSIRIDLSGAHPAEKATVARLARRARCGLPAPSRPAGRQQPRSPADNSGPRPDRPPGTSPSAPGGGEAGR